MYPSLDKADIFPEVGARPSLFRKATFAAKGLPSSGTPNYYQRKCYVFGKRSPFTCEYLGLIAVKWGSNRSSVRTTFFYEPASLFCQKDNWGKFRGFPLSALSARGVAPQDGVPRLHNPFALFRVFSPPGLVKNLWPSGLRTSAPRMAYEGIWQAGQSSSKRYSRKKIVWSVEKKAEMNLPTYYQW